MKQNEVFGGEGIESRVFMFVLVVVGGVFFGVGWEWGWFCLFWFVGCGMLDLDYHALHWKFRGRDCV